MNDIETIIGVDFASPAKALQQRRKIIALAATRLDKNVYWIARDGFNDRIQAADGPGWTAEELAEVLIETALARVVAFDFPFSIPRSLLDDPGFASAVGQRQPFKTWLIFNSFVAASLPLRCPIDLTPFAGWRTKANWRRRATDIAATAQPPLKDRFQVLFNMTLLGNALLARLAASGHYRIVPFGEPGPANEIIEVYPGLTMRDVRHPRYKSDPVGAIDAILASCLVHGIRIDVDREVRRFCENYNTGGTHGSDPDGSDALIALTTAILYREGHATEAVDADAWDLRLIEGAIWRPAPTPMI